MAVKLLIDAEITEVQCLTINAFRLSSMRTWVSNSRFSSGRTRSSRAVRSWLPMLPRGNDQKPGGSAAQEMTADEISILAEDNPPITVGNRRDHIVAAAIPVGQVKSMQDIATQSFQRPNERSRQLGVQQDPHAERSSTR
jgi:hypothetical protein